MKAFLVKLLLVIVFVLCILNLNVVVHIGEQVVSLFNNSVELPYGKSVLMKRTDPEGLAIIDAGFKHAQKKGLSEEQSQEFVWALFAIAKLESQIDADSHGDGGCSIGLFQLNTCGGRGSNYKSNRQALENPWLNADIAASYLVDYYKTAKQQNLKGADVAYYMELNGQRPTAEYAVVVKNYWDQLKADFKQYA